MEVIVTYNDETTDVAWIIELFAAGAVVEFVDGKLEFVPYSALTHNINAAEFNTVRRERENKRNRLIASKVIQPEKRETILVHA